MPDIRNARWRFTLRDMLAGFVCTLFLALGSTRACADQFSDAVAGQALWTGAPGCSGCHLSPIWLSGSDRTGGTQSLHDYIANVPSDSTFQQFLHNAGAQMKAWGDAALPTPLTQMQAFLLGTRDAIVTPSLTFSSTVVNPPLPLPSQNVQVQNLRFYDISYASLTLSNTTDFELGIQSCQSNGNTVSAGGGFCTIEIRFQPQSVGTKTATLSFTLSGDSREPALQARTGSSAVQISGTGVLAPVASITAPPATPAVTVVATGSTIALAGTSTDPNSAGINLHYGWTITKDGAAFTTLSGASASFQATGHGTYVVQLVTSDSYGSSAPVTRTVLAVDRPTAAIAVTSPANGHYYSGDSITVDGGGSTHQAGDTLNYAWTVTSGGSNVAFTTSGSSATFTAAGTQSYIVTLDVDDQGIHATSPASVTISSGPAPAPTAHIANAGTVLVNQQVALSSAGSQAGDGGGTFTCSWVVTQHGGAAQTVSNPLTCGSAAFTPTATGDYNVTLTVTDGHGSAQATATITASNVQVTITAGAQQTALLGSTVSLTGVAAPIAGDSFTYAWTLTSAPAGSTSTIASPTSSTGASLVVDQAGTFVARLTATATDSQHPSGFAETTIAVSPPLTANMQSLPFTTALGSSIVATAVVTNNSGSPIAPQSLGFGGAVPGDFALDASNACVQGVPIAVGSTCNLAVRFTPTDVGARNATLTLAYAATGSPLSVTLLGTATPRPQGVISSTTWSQVFDDTAVGSTNAKTITLTNTSSGASAAPIVFSSFTLAGGASGDYQLGGTCSVSAPLASQANCTLLLTFAPSTTGTRAASLQIASNASNPLASIGLTGNGLPAPVPALTITPSPLNFGSQTLGGAYPSQVATLTNTGTAPLAISTIGITGADFTIVDASACTGATLAINASCAARVSFAPSSVQADIRGALTIASNAPGSPATLTLVGTGTAAAAPVLAWSPAVSTLDFGTVQAGAVSATQSVVLTNQGPGGATVGLVNAVGIGSSAFSIKYSACSAMQPMYAGDSCRIDIAFAPAAGGARSATLQVVSNGSAPAPVTLSGTGSGGPALTLALSTTALDFGAVQLGTRSQPSMLRLSNSGSGALQIAAINATGAFRVQGASCPAAPFTLQSGAECSVAVMFQPTSAGAASGTLSVQSDAQAQPGDVALTGQADAAPDLSSGGCSASRGGGRFDPMLWGLAGAALLALAWRRRQRRRDARRETEIAR